MAKAYTNIEQSRKLAEILPIETSDMAWVTDNDVIVVPFNEVARDNVLYAYIPCWSLAALLGIIAFPVLSQREDGRWEAWSFPKSSLGEVSIQDDPVDACVDLIISLNSKK